MVKLDNLEGNILEMNLSGYRWICRRINYFLLLCLCVLPAGCDRAANFAPHSLWRNGARTVSFAVLEDYDKGADLKEVARDFQLMRELGIDVLRCSIGWDDYEPFQGEYDFTWLKEFVRLAARHGIKLRPYIGYTPRWAAAEGSADGKEWNNPPADYQTWYRFVYQLAYALRDYPNVLSYEIYNEQNARLWWDGSIDQYKETLRHAALAIRVADPDAQIILGGFVMPDADWLRSITQSGHARYYDISAFHAYPETWSPPEVAVENYLGPQYREFVAYNNRAGEREPIWINEMGFATTPNKTELDQANWWARAVSTFLADAHVQHIGVYEIKDLPTGKSVIGDEKNHYLGLTRADYTKKVAFHTVALLKKLLGSGKIIPSDAGLALKLTSGRAVDLHWRLFYRHDGKQVLFIYDKNGNPRVEATLAKSGKTAVKYELNGTAASYGDFDGRTLANIHLTAGNVAIFQIDP
jgi:polysaccharide biosynthesis protein PslG